MAADQLAGDEFRQEPDPCRPLAASQGLLAAARARLPTGTTFDPSGVCGYTRQEFEMAVMLTDGLRIEGDLWEVYFVTCERRLTGADWWCGPLGTLRQLRRLRRLRVDRIFLRERASAKPGSVVMGRIDELAEPFKARVPHYERGDAQARSITKAHLLTVSEIGSYEEGLLPVRLASPGAGSGFWRMRERRTPERRSSCDVGTGRSES